MSYHQSGRVQVEVCEIETTEPGSQEYKNNRTRACFLFSLCITPCTTGYIFALSCLVFWAMVSRSVWTFISHHLSLEHEVRQTTEVTLLVSKQLNGGIGLVPLCVCCGLRRENHTGGTTAWLYNQCLKWAARSVQPTLSKWHLQR